MCHRDDSFLNFGSFGLLALLALLAARVNFGLQRLHLTSLPNPSSLPDLRESATNVCIIVLSRGRENGGGAHGMDPQGLPVPMMLR